MDGPLKVGAKPVERRFKLYFVSLGALLALLNSRDATVEAVEDDCDLPADALALSATFDYLRNGFAVLIWSESFGIVPEGCEIPWSSSPWTYYRVRHE